ncbi:MAG: hypothetical protein KF716_06140 [Anaerolineae bacterium]|nr:hypothetical protein [Anaerolineae bacterium]
MKKGTVIALVAIVVIITAMATLLVVYQRNNMVLPTSTAAGTAILDPTTLAEIGAKSNCFFQYLEDTDKVELCEKTGGFVDGVSTRIP